MQNQNETYLSMCAAPSDLVCVFAGRDGSLYRERVVALVLAEEREPDGSVTRYVKPILADGPYLTAEFEESPEDRDDFVAFEVGGVEKSWAEYEPAGMIPASVLKAVRGQRRAEVKA